MSAEGSVIDASVYPLKSQAYVTSILNNLWISNDPATKTSDRSIEVFGIGYEKTMGRSLLPIVEPLVFAVEGVVITKKDLKKNFVTVAVSSDNTAVTNFIDAFDNRLVELVTFGKCKYMGIWDSWEKMKIESNALMTSIQCHRRMDITVQCELIWHTPKEWGTKWKLISVNSRSSSTHKALETAGETKKNLALEEISEIKETIGSNDDFSDEDYAETSDNYDNSIYY